MIVPHSPAHRARARLAVGMLAVALALTGCGSSRSASQVVTTSANPAAVAASPTVRRIAGDGLGEATPPPSIRPSSTPEPSPSHAAEPARTAFAMNLYRAGDFVAQYTFDWCVGASLQMALNIATERSSTSRIEQQTLWKMAQARSDSPFGGANPRGWTAALNQLGIGPYRLVSVPDFDEALQVAATAIRATRRPVGLVMWRGRHAWVMSGFESIGDPRVHDDVEVTGIRVLDPLYPHGSRRWGPSPRPNALVRPDILARQFVVRDSTRVNLGVPPGYLLVLPVTTSPDATGSEPKA